MNPLLPMLDLSSPHRSFRHTVRSALESLAAIGIPDSRIILRNRGPVASDGLVVSQSPGPGEPLNQDVTIELHVTGAGMFYRMPAGMQEWDSLGRRIGTRQIVELFDDPIEKARYLISEGDRLFGISPGDPAACARWLRIFGQRPEDWPVRMWHDLALLLPSLQKVAGTANGIHLTLDLLLRLPVEDMVFEPAFTAVPESARMVLSGTPRQLGVDTVIGEQLEELASLKLIIGPVALPVYEQFRQEESERLLHQVLRLCMPFYQRYSIGWSVLDRSKPVQLGEPAGNSNLGVNSYLGQEAAQPAEDNNG
jgi:hypothetical protein